MIQYAQKEHRLILMDLWKLSFPDTDSFVRFYFNRIFQEEETLILIENGILVASLQMIPYSVKTGDTIISAGYISGAMTHPDHRRKGHMDRLLFFAFEEMKKKNYAFSFLIPQEKWLFGFYKKYGYKDAFPVCFPVTYDCEVAFNQDVSSGINIYQDTGSLDIETLYSVYHTFLSQKENVILKSLEQFSAMLEDLFLDGGCIFSGKEGIAFSLAEKGSVKVKELFSEDEKAKRQILFSIARHYSSKEIMVLNSGITPCSHLSGMIKTLNDNLLLPDNIYMSMMLD